MAYVSHDSDTTTTIHEYGGFDKTTKKCYVTSVTSELLPLSGD